MSDSAAPPERGPRLRILLVGTAHGAEIRGASQAIHGLASALAARHDVTLLQAAAPAHRIAIPGVRMRYVAQTRKSRYPLRFAAERISHFDLVHACDQAAGPLALRARLAGAPLVAELHPGRLHTERLWRAGWRWRWMRLAIRAAPAILVPSRWLAEALVATYRIDPRRVHAIPHGVAEHWFEGGLAAPAAPLRIVLVNMRGVETALRAFARIAARVPGVRLELYGRHRRVEELRALAAALGIAGQVEVAGFVPNASLPGRLRGAALLLHPTDAESFGQVLAEAAALGLPVVASRVGATPELVVHGETGLLCPVGDADAFADALLRLLADPALGASMGRAARSRARALWRWESVVARIERELYAPLRAARSATRTSPIP